MIDSYLHKLESLGGHREFDTSDLVKELQECLQLQDVIGLRLLLPFVIEMLPEQVPSKECKCICR